MAQAPPAQSQATPHRQDLLPRQRCRDQCPPRDLADLLALGWMGLSPRLERSLEMALAHQAHQEY